MADMKLNKPLIRKMIKRIEEKPRGFDQNAAYAQRNSNAPCGTVVCLAGEAAICSKRTEEGGIRFAINGLYDPHRLMGICRTSSIFMVEGMGWPAPFRSQYRKARTATARAKVAADFLREILRTDGKILTKE